MVQYFPCALMTISEAVSNEFEVFIKLISLILSAQCALGIHCQPICWCKKGPRSHQTALWCFSLSLSCHSPNITSPQSDLTTVVSSPGQNGLICAEREKERNGREAKRERIESPAEKKRMGLEGGGVRRAVVNRKCDEERRKKEKRSLIGLRLVAPAQSLPFDPDRNQIILKFFNKSMKIC